MTKGALTKSSRGAIATGATAAGAASLGAMALGAVALGAIAVGALAIGRLTVGRARLRRVEIGELSVGRLDLGAELTAVARIHAAPGKGDALERLLLDQVARGDPGTLLYRAHRSRINPDLFLFLEYHANEAAFEQHAPASQFDALLRHAAGQGLIADPIEVELYHTI